MRKCCIIIETRPLSNLYEIIKDKHLKYIPQDWDLIIYGSSLNKFIVDKDYGRPHKFISLPQARLNSISYNNLITSSKFWLEIPYDKVLIFQSDSEILRNGIEYFLDYDFIGAPLKHIDFPCMNGGLSLRSTKAMFEITRDNDFHGFCGNEDIYFCKAMEKGNYNLPDFETARLFSVETIYGTGSLGAHAIDKWHHTKQCEIIRSQYNG